MAKKILKILIIILIAGAIIYRYFLYFDFYNDCYIKIKPSFTELSNINIKKAILVLKRADPEEYKLFCSHVEKIDPNLACGGFGGGCFYHNAKKEISISTSNNSHLGWTASIIAHETCHAVQAEENRPFSEEECYTHGNNVLKKVVEY